MIEADLWSAEIDALVNAGFASVSRNPSDHETVVAYRTAIALALAAGSRRAKTAKPVECEASQSGPKGNAQTQSQHPKGNN